MRTSVYAAKWILPVDGPLIEDGEVVVEDGVIVDVRARRTPGDACSDLGRALLMPGFVNLHTHLEYTALRGVFEDMPFFAWIRALTALKPRWTPDDWTWSSRLGALECIAGGITTIGDNADLGPVARVAADCGLRATVYQEVFGPDPRDPIGPILDGLRAKLAGMKPALSERVRMGISPHAPYTVRPELFTAIVELAADTGLPISFHLAESLAESELIANGIGEFAEMYERRGIAWAVPGGTPTAYAHGLGALNSGAMAVHCVQQTPEDIALFGRTGAAIAHCPKSNAKLGAGIAPLSAWLAIPGLRVGLGTDSAVSNNRLDMFEEMRFALLAQRAVRRDARAVTAGQMVRLATLGGAEAMGLADRTGSLTPGKRADLIAVRMDGPQVTPVGTPEAALVYSASAADVALVVVDGEVLFDEGEWRTMDAPLIVAECGAARERLRPR